MIDNIDNIDKIYKIDEIDEIDGYKYQNKDYFSQENSALLWLNLQGVIEHL
jgi:hypothetical protein